MIENYHTGGGCMALQVTEPDVLELHALVTHADGGRIPENPETDAMLIGVYVFDFETGGFYPSRLTPKRWL